MAEWSHVAPIAVRQMPRAGLVEFTLTPEVFDLAQGDLCDLRVVTDAADELGYALRIAEGKEESVPLAIALYNRTYIPGKQSSITVDFGAKILKNRIEVITPGTNFRRQVLVEGADDGLSWQKVREGAFLFRISQDSLRNAYDKDEVSLPDNDQRYLRVTVYNAPDDPKQVDVKNVKAWCVVRRPPETVPVPLVVTGPSEDQKNKRTEITLDLGHRNLPLYELALDFSNADFYRHVRISGRNATERVVKTRVEDAPELEKKVAEPWTDVGGGSVYRYSSGGSVDESLALGLSGARYRYLRVQIENADDPPLQFRSAQVKRLVYYVAFQAKGKACSLFFGNPRAQRPSYDIVNYSERLRKEGCVAISLGKVVPNPAYAQAEKVIPWSERHKSIIWVALLGVAVVLLLLVYRMAKSAPRAE
jgi:hypothetical protein